MNEKNRYSITMSTVFLTCFKVGLYELEEIYHAIKKGEED